MSVKDFAQAEYRGAPLVNQLNCRLPKRLSVFLRTAALIDGVPESTLVRYALTRWAEAQGYDSNGA